MSVADKSSSAARSPAGLVACDFRAQRARAASFSGGWACDLDRPLPSRRFRSRVQQMIEIAKALAFEARVLIMDEPTAP